MITPQPIDADLPQLALQLAMEHPLDTIGGSNIYHVREPWQHAELPQHPAVTVVRDGATLEAAIASPASPMLYVPADAAITPALLRAALQRHGLLKTILWEGN